MVKISGGREVAPMGNACQKSWGSSFD